MNYKLIGEVLALLESFEESDQKTYSQNLGGFREWLCCQDDVLDFKSESVWDGKEDGRSSDSVICTLITKLSRYSRIYGKLAIANSEFTTQEEFIYLINLRVNGAMTKMELIRQNVHQKPVGIQIIGRLLKRGWIEQEESTSDRRSKVIHLTDSGLKALEKQMPEIRRASSVVCGDLTQVERQEFIRLMTRLDNFHESVQQEKTSESETLKTLTERLNPS